MIRYLNNEQVEMRRDGCEGEDPIVVAESDNTPYTLYSVPRWNKDNAVVERYYEVYNAETGVVEQRARTNLLTAASAFETICHLYLELQEHGTVEELNEAADRKDPASPTLQ